MREALLPDRIFDGERFLSDTALLLEAGRIVGLCHKDAVQECHVTRLSGTICAGFVDLQVNGGGGVMLDGASSAETIAQICAAHARLGATTILPTLITDTPQATRAVIAAAIAHGGLVGLHLEGPHLDPRRRGAHDPALIRPMNDADLKLLIAARVHLPALMVTLAPCAVGNDQIARLAQAGVVVSLGHSDCTKDQADTAIASGAACATHLFNAMSPLGHREPGLVGAILSSNLTAGLIADGLHVAPDILQLALRLRPSGLFLVSDCMALAGSDLTRMHLGGREILRHQGRLTLQDGTLAGADLTLPQAIARVVDLGVPLTDALRMATATPASVIGADAGRLHPGRRADLVHFTDDLSVSAIWHGGQMLQPARDQALPAPMSVAG